jgi:hypothetical protein
MEQVMLEHRQSSSCLAFVYQAIYASPDFLSIDSAKKA